MFRSSKQVFHFILADGPGRRLHVLRQEGDFEVDFLLGAGGREEKDLAALMVEEYHSWKHYQLSGDPEAHREVTWQLVVWLYDHGTRCVWSRD